MTPAVATTLPTTLATAALAALLLVSGIVTPGWTGRAEAVGMAEGSPAATSPSPLRSFATAGHPQAPDGAARIVTGWLPYWTTDASVTSYLANASLFSEVSPFWHSTRWDAAGRRTEVVSYLPDGTRRSALARLRAAGRPIVPSVTDGTPARRMSRVLRDPGLMREHVRQLVDLVQRNGYDGIDLDYEGFAFRDGRDSWAVTRPAWVAFLRRLGTALHRRDRMLTVAIPPMCDTVLRCGGENGYWVYDAAAIAGPVDRIRIMTYDYSWDAPGPISPQPWARGVAEYAASVIPPRKVQIGAPTYGYDWARLDRADADGDGDTGERLLTGDCPDHGRGAPAAQRRAYRALTERDEVSGAAVGSLRARVGSPRLRWDEQARAPWFRYRVSRTWSDEDGRSKRCTVHREVWFSDARTMADRARVVTDLGLRGLAMWDIGYENRAQWPALRRAARNSG